MASPVVQAVAETAVSTASTTHTINLPASIAAGDLLILILSKGSVAATINAHADWTELLDENLAIGFYIAYRWATGSEGATTTLTSSANTRSATLAYRISGAADPATQPPQIATTATGSSTTPNSDNISPTGGAKDYLFISTFGRGGEEADDDTWVTAAPSGYSNLLQKACGVAGTNLGGMVAAAERAANTASENPLTFTAATGSWRAQTIAIHPAAAANHTATPADTLGLTDARSVSQGHGRAQGDTLGLTDSATTQQLQPGRYRRRIQVLL